MQSDNVLPIPKLREGDMREETIPDASGPEGSNPRSIGADSTLNNMQVIKALILKKGIPSAF
ncbi:MAG: hypothetical protein HY878_02675 [Deltaproteobacteria bacterium]|nr:hypothetical protein [Deltaproteobacteria bacterium]